MKIAGIVCEYNPMHNGHVYHIEQTRKKGATHIVCAMSGNFVQRGECAFLDKWTRADIAVHCGADLVIDLPTPWSCSSAQNFAFGAVSLLTYAGIDMLSFGSEISDIALLEKCANASDDERVVEILKKSLSNGSSYPLSLYNAVCEIFGKETADVISSPNSTLALEYIKSLKKLGSKAEILPIKRFASSHDATELNGAFSSASALRLLEDFNLAKNFMPEYSFEKTLEQLKNGYAPCTLQNAERAILSSLRLISDSEMASFVDSENGLSNRIYNAVKTSVTLEELFGNIKTKNITMAKVRRSIMQIYLGINAQTAIQKPPYIKVLASNEKGFEVLKKISPDIPVISKHSDALKLDGFARNIYDLQCRTTDLFALFSKKTRACCLEQTSPVVILK